MVLYNLVGTKKKGVTLLKQLRSNVLSLVQPLNCGNLYQVSILWPTTMSSSAHAVMCKIIRLVAKIDADRRQHAGVTERTSYGA